MSTKGHAHSIDQQTELSRGLSPTVPTSCSMAASTLAPASCRPPIRWNEIERERKRIVSDRSGDYLISSNDFLINKGDECVYVKLVKILV